MGASNSQRRSSAAICSGVRNKKQTRRKFLINFLVVSVMLITFFGMILAVILVSLRRSRIAEANACLLYTSWTGFLPAQADGIQ